LQAVVLSLVVLVVLYCTSARLLRVSLRYERRLSWRQQLSCFEHRAIAVSEDTLIELASIPTCSGLYYALRSPFGYLHHISTHIDNIEATRSFGSRVWIRTFRLRLCRSRSGQWQLCSFGCLEGELINDRTPDHRWSYKP